MKRTRDDEIESNEHKRVTLKFIDDKTLVPNLMDMTPEMRRQSLEANPISSFGYPSEYSRIYSLEKDRRIFNGFENLKNVTNEKIFHKGKEQVFSSKTQIQCVTNVNCIKSKIKVPNVDINTVNFSKEAKEIMKNYGITYYNNKHDFKYSKGNNNKSYDDYLKTIPNKYNVIISLIRKVFKEYKDYICIAGGFSLSNYINHNYDYYVDFSDIDLFIHSCDQETANKITSLLTVLCGPNIYENENVIMGDDLGMFDNKNTDLTDGPNVKNIKIQIIKRLYSCPQEIIVGFDIDCCCILTTLDNKTFITERGYNAIKNGYNVINFEKLSPSYEYRLSKYNNRGFGIWIPFIEHFKKNVFFDYNVIDRNKGSSIIITELMNTRKQRNYYKEVNDRPEYLTEDYGVAKDPIQFPVVFKSLNPGEQRINTFHRIFLNDPKEWYPEYPENGIDNFKHDIYSDSIVPVITNNKFQFTLAQNIQRNIKLKPVSDSVKHESLELIEYVKNIVPGVTILGDLPYRAITGDPNHKQNVNIWSPNITNYEIKNEIDNNIIKVKVLLSVKNYIKDNLNMNVSNLNDIGRVVFTSDIKNALNVTKDENIFINRTYDFKVLHYYGRDELKDYNIYNTCIVFIATEGTFNLLKEIRSVNYIKTIKRLKNSDKIYSNSYVKTYITSKMDDINPRQNKFRPIYTNISKDEIIGYLSNENNYIDVINNCMVNEFSYLKDFFVNIRIDIGGGKSSLEDYINKCETNIDIDGIMYHNGAFMGIENSYHKAIKGINYDMDKVKILDYPIYENFIVEN